MRFMNSMILSAVLLAVGLPVGAAAQSPDADGADWPLYRGSLAGTGYSPLTVIAPDNVAGLARAWTYDLTRATPDASGRGPNSQVTPIVVDGVMYLPAADRVVALNPETGEEIWSRPVAGRAPSRRGVAWWPGDDENTPRILFTNGLRLHALNAATGSAPACPERRHR
jgi:quinoprotein glucose dehydrogenase